MTPPFGPAEESVLDLNRVMMSTYDEELADHRRDLLAAAPVLLARFSGAGGEMTLYRPGLPPVEAEPVPVGYQLVKSVAHSLLAVQQVVRPAVADPAGASWLTPLRALLARHADALGHLPDLGATGVDTDLLRAVVERNAAFLRACSERRRCTADDLEEYAAASAGSARACIDAAAAVQVGHWMRVVEGWRELLGDAWGSTYAVTNTLHVTREKNILFTVLARFLGEEAIGDRLLLVETPEFTTTRETLLDLLARIVADRAAGRLFFRSWFLMDAELLGDAARAAVEREARTRGMRPLLPTAAPVGSREWPWRTDPAAAVSPDP